MSDLDDLFNEYGGKKAETFEQAFGRIINETKKIHEEFAKQKGGCKGGTCGTNAGRQQSHRSYSPPPEPEYHRGGVDAEFASFQASWEGRDPSTIRKAGAKQFKGYTRNDPHDVEMMTRINQWVDGMKKKRRFW